MLEYLLHRMPAELSEPGPEKKNKKKTTEVNGRLKHKAFFFSG